MVCAAVLIAVGRAMRGFSRLLPSVFLGAALMTGAMPVLAAECKPLSRVMSLDIKALPGGRPGVPVMIGNTPEIFVVETGFIFSSVTRATAQKYKLTAGRSRRFLTGLIGPNLAISDQEVRLPSITIGNLTEAKPLLMIWPPTEAASQPREFAGSLGADFLAGFDLDFDFAAGKLNLMSPDHCAGQVVYWKAPAVAVVPMRLDTSSNIWFPITLDGKPVEAWLNTGDERSSLSLADAQVMFNVDVNAPDTERIGDLAGASSFTVYRRQFKTLSIEGVTITNPRLVLLPDVVTVSPGRDGLVTLGMSILRQLHIYVAYKERKLYITAANPDPAQ